VEVGGFEGSGIELDAAFGHDGIEFGEGFEVGVGERLIEDGPKTLGGLEFGRVGRQIDEFDAVRDGEAGGAMPAGIVEHQHDRTFSAGSGFSREGGEQGFKEGL